MLSKHIKKETLEIRVQDEDHKEEESLGAPSSASWLRVKRKEKKALRTKPQRALRFTKKKKYLVLLRVLRDPVGCQAGSCEKKEQHLLSPGIQ